MDIQQLKCNICNAPLTKSTDGYKCEYCETNYITKAINQNKIVVNRCYGGFGLSDKAIEMYLRMNAKKCYRYIQTRCNHRDGDDEFKFIDNPINDRFEITYYFTEFQGNTFSEWSDDETYFTDCEIKRNDPTLVKVVEILGEKANGYFASLDIVEIPDGVQWEIEEYDGKEWVSEVHRTW